MTENQVQREIVTTLGLIVLGKKIREILPGPDIALILDNLDTKAFPQSFLGEAFITIGSPWNVLTQIPKVSLNDHSKAAFSPLHDFDVLCAQLICRMICVLEVD